MIPLQSLRYTYVGDNPPMDNPELWNHYLEIIQLIRHVVFEEKPACEPDSDEPIFRNPGRERFLNEESQVHYALYYDVIIPLIDGVTHEPVDFTCDRRLTVDLVKSSKQILVQDKCLNSYDDDLETFNVINYEAYGEPTIRRLEEPETFKELLNHWLHIDRYKYSNFFLQDEMGKITTKFIDKYNDEWSDKMKSILTSANLRENYIQDDSYQFGHRVWKIPEMQKLILEKGYHKDPYKYLTQDDNS